jgi:hypothetical protein
VIYTYAVFLQSIDIRRAEIKAGLLGAVLDAFLAIDYPKMAFFIYPEAIQK